jgi:hypothetical protein
MSITRFGLAVSLALITACRPSLQSTAESAVRALAAHDMATIGALADPAKGIRFSPYAHVDTTRDQVIPKESFDSLWASSMPAVWGTHDGSGEPIRLTYAEYHRTFVYDRDFARAPRVEYNAPPVGRGNTPNNIAASYPNASIVEFHVPGEEKNAGMDWRSLWLVFEKSAATWHLVAIVHGSWTI